MIYLPEILRNLTFFHFTSLLAVLWSSLLIILPSYHGLSLFLYFHFYAVYWLCEVFKSTSQGRIKVVAARCWSLVLIKPITYFKFTTSPKKVFVSEFLLSGFNAHNLFHCICESVLLWKLNFLMNNTYYVTHNMESSKHQVGTQ